ncbi:MAG: S41 family peptidase [Bacteroidales bacterium]
MNKNFFKSEYAIAILGVLIGFLIALTFNKLTTSKIRKVDQRDWRKVSLILNEIAANYVDTIDVTKITDGAVEGALSALDPHSIYMPPAVLKETQTDLAGNFDGIGIQFNVPNDTAIVLEVIPGGPSEKVGLQKGDRIIKVDKKVIAGVKCAQDTMVSKMKGPSGTKVEVTVERGGTLIPFNITRGKIPVHSVDASFMINDTTGYIRLSKFTRTTYDEFKEASEKLLSSGMKRLIFDLRDNPGGYFEQSFKLSNEFLKKNDEVVYLKGLHRKKEDYKADGKGELTDVRLSVLINENSASSSEIFAGAIQDNDRGVIVGRRSYGKGLVQEPILFTDGSGIRITVARYYTPSGRCIQKPYDNLEDYQYDIYNRYEHGELTSADSIKVNKDEAFKTIGGRTVYGGGGITPDIFVAMDTTRASSFFVKCNKKATQMRFASSMFDKYKTSLSEINDFKTLNSFLDKMDIPSKFKSYASSTDGITPTAKEWAETQEYLVPQLRALIGRYSKLGENAFYKLYLSVDTTLQKALESSITVK